MTENKMYSQRAANIPVVRICLFDCGYCAFERFRKMSKCQKCRDNVPHSHLEVLSRKPPKSQPDEFVTVGLSGDVSFMLPEDFQKVLDYCESWIDTTFLIQSKNPNYFVEFLQAYPHSFIPENTIIGTTVETDIIHWDTAQQWKQNDQKIVSYSDISKAPHPYLRFRAMIKLQCRKAITIEPIMDFNLTRMLTWIKPINPEFCYIGYANDGKQGKRLRLPEPTLEKTMELIAKLREVGIDCREKTLRPAWYEQKESFFKKWDTAIQEMEF